MTDIEIAYTGTTEDGRRVRVTVGGINITVSINGETDADLHVWQEPIQRFDARALSRWLVDDASMLTDAGKVCLAAYMAVLAWRLV